MTLGTNVNLCFGRSEILETTIQNSVSTWLEILLLNFRGLEKYTPQNWNFETTLFVLILRPLSYGRRHV